MTTRRSSSSPRKAPEFVGWREWVSFPELGVGGMKAKIDTGARTSALHAFDVRVFESEGRFLVAFKVHPRQRGSRTAIAAEAVPIETRHVRSSSGKVQTRIMILTEIEMLGQRFPIELTLASRDSMGFRLILGRQALKGRFVVDPSRSFLGGSKRPGAVRKASSSAKKARPKRTKKKELPAP